MSMRFAQCLIQPLACRFLTISGVFWSEFGPGICGDRAKKGLSPLLSPLGTAENFRTAEDVLEGEFLRAWVEGLEELDVSFHVFGGGGAFRDPAIGQQGCYSQVCFRNIDFFCVHTCSFFLTSRAQRQAGGTGVFSGVPEASSEHWQGGEFEGLRGKGCPANYYLSKRSGALQWCPAKESVQGDQPARSVKQREAMAPKSNFVCVSSMPKPQMVSCLGKLSVQAGQFPLMESTEATEAMPLGFFVGRISQGPAHRVMMRALGTAGQAEAVSVTGN